MSKYYYFEAKGLGTHPVMGDKRENWEGAFNMGLGGVLTDALVKAVNKNGEKIRKSPRNPRFYESEDLTVVKPGEWNAPDLGKMKEKCLASSVGMTEYMLKMKPLIEKWFLEKEKPDGNPQMIIASGNEGFGVFACIYEITPGKMQFTETKPKKEKKGLFGW